MMDRGHVNSGIHLWYRSYKAYLNHVYSYAFWQRMLSQTSPQRLYRARLKVLVAALVVCIIYCFSGGLSGVTYSEPKGDMIVISATHYKNSTFYDPNTVAVLFTAEKSIPPTQRWHCVSKNASGDLLVTETSPRNAYRPIKECLWTTFIATCNTVANPSTIRLTGAPTAEKSVVLPFQPAIDEHLPVVACFSPLFFNERWQLVGLSIESYAAAGVSRQAYYVMSALKGVHDLLKIYETSRRRLVDVHYWTLPKHPEAKLQLDWRDQASAHADCYLKYRDAADFIIVSDIDDLLFPRYGPTLHSEFSQLTHNLPGVASFFYPRFDAEVLSETTFKKFHPATTLKHVRISNKASTGKSVHNTREVEVVWIHWADVKKGNATYYKLSPEDNMFVHVRNWTFGVDPNDFMQKSLSKPRNRIFPTIQSIIPPGLIRRMSEGFNETFEKWDNRKIMNRVKTTDYYYDAIDNCYNNMLNAVDIHNKNPEAQGVICPTPARCIIDRIPNVPCVVAHRTYKKVTLAPDWKFNNPVQDYSVRMERHGCILS
uniref:Glycosyltransferase family 92 protein n=1 Tax=Panagrellus redivivus TaxID=6233 RepID=A0A7E4ZVZ0_PANRE